MSAGRPPVPANILKLRGTDRPDRVRDDEPQPTVEAPSCPSWLGKEAKREWRRVVPLLLENRVLTKLDRAALAAYCEAYQAWYDAVRLLAAEGVTFSSPNGHVCVRPEVAIRDRSRDSMVKYLVQFGMSPSSRRKVAQIKPEAEDDGGEWWES